MNLFGLGVSYLNNKTQTHDGDCSATVVFWTEKCEKIKNKKFIALTPSL